MAGAGAAISSALSLAAKLLPVVDELAEDLSCSSSDQSKRAAEIKQDLKSLMILLEQIKPHLSDAEEKLFTDRSDRSVGIWLTELKKVAYKAEDVLDGYYYEVLRRQAETANSHERKRTQGSSSLQFPAPLPNPPATLSWCSATAPPPWCSATTPPPRLRRGAPPCQFAPLSTSDCTSPVHVLALDGDQIKRIIRHLDEIRGGILSLRLKRDKGVPMQTDPTSDFVVEHEIVGLDNDMEKLISLLSECGGGRVISVVAVVGPGGLGKTTLVQLAYNDHGLRQRFHKVGWICVSDDFDVVRLLREALKSITNQDCDLYSLSALQKRLCQEIRGKKLLLVLDDVWNENSSLWELFCLPFTSAKLVKIVITTRNKFVARMMQVEHILYPTFSSEKECWQLFQHFAFGINENIDLELVEIGRKIMKKCGFLPLAIILVASVLRHEAEETTWREVLESKLWKEGPSGVSILSALMISYLRLSTYLKPCLLYSSMFPKDYEFDVEYLSQLLVAHGYIRSRGGLRKAGQEYIKQLWMRSFFICQFSGSDFKNGKLKLHDLIHDLALFISKEGFHICSQSDIHLYVMDNMKIVEPLTSHCLRTLIVGDNVKNFLAASDVSKLQSLRVLELKSQCCDSEFLSSIGNFKHLRYLSLGSFSFQRLPESIGLLYNLQNLALTKCTALEELPNGIGNLVNLQVLRLTCCLRFQRLPECIGNFRNLEKLVLDKCDIRELPAGICQLYALQELLITGCRNLNDLPEDIGRLSALEMLVIEATGVRYLPHSLNNVKGLKKLILTFKKREQ